MTEDQAREEICRVGRSLFERGYVHATAGNISVRLDGGTGFLITPTDACLGFLDPAQLARIDSTGMQTSGLLASKTLALHRRIYREARRFDHDAQCIIHTHSAHCVALTLRDEVADAADAAAAADATDAAGPAAATRERELLPPLTPYFVMKVGHVPVIPYHRPGSEEAVELTARAIARYGERGTPIRAVMLARLGPNVWHATPAAAMAVLEELEETARLQIVMLAGGSGSQAAPVLSEAEIAELRDNFHARW